MNEMPSGSADRMIHLLKLVTAGPDHFSLGHLAERARLPASTVHRLLQVLLRSGLVERGPAQSYRIGRELYRISSQLVSRFDLGRCARPLLERLVTEWQQTTVLCAYSPVARHAVVVDLVVSPQGPRFSIGKGDAIELPWGCFGRSILAFLAPGEIEAILRDVKAGPVCGLPVPLRHDMEQQLTAIRAGGVARCFDPRLDLAGVAAPIFGADRAILGCVGVAMSSGRGRQHAPDDLALAVRDAARELSSAAAVATG